MSATPASLAGTTYSWIATTDDSLQNQSNWNPTPGPGTNDTGEFDSTKPRINLTPTATSEYEVGSFHFVNSASAFSFAFNNCMFEMTPGVAPAITGTNTNTLITATNTDNSTVFSRPQIHFSGSTGSGNANINAVNIGHLSGNESNEQISVIGDFKNQIAASGAPFAILDGSQYIASNTGVKTTLPDLATIELVSLAIRNYFFSKIFL